MFQRTTRRQITKHVADVLYNEMSVRFLFQLQKQDTSQYIPEKSYQKHTN